MSHCHKPPHKDEHHCKPRKKKWHHKHDKCEDKRKKPCHKPGPVHVPGGGGGPRSGGGGGGPRN